MKTLNIFQTYFCQFTSTKLVIFYEHQKVGLIQKQRYLYFTQPCQKNQYKLLFPKCKIMQVYKQYIIQATNYLLAYLVII